MADEADKYDHAYALKQGLLSGYAGAFKSLFQDEKKKRENAEALIKTLTEQLDETNKLLQKATEQRDFWRSQNKTKSLMLDETNFT